jgi:hypothetical protein
MRITLRTEGLAAVRRLESIGGDVRRATVRALNRTIGTAQTATLRALAADTGLAQKDLRPSLEIQRATFQRQEATLIVTGRRIPLLGFRARQTRRGVTYRLPGGRGRAPRAFLATMRSGHTGVFQRRGAPRLPIHELFGPSLPHVVRRRAIFEAVGRDAEATLEKNLAHEVEFLLRRPAGAGRGGGDA